MTKKARLTKAKAEPEVKEPGEAGPDEAGKASEAGKGNAGPLSRKTRYSWRWKRR